MHSNDNDTKLRVTKYMNRAIEKLLQDDSYKSKRHFVNKSVESQIDWFKQSVKGQRTLYNFINNINDDVSWLDLDVSDEYITPRLHIDKSLDVVRTCNLSPETKSDISWCASAIGNTQSSIIRLCMIKQLSCESHLLSEAMSMQVEERWLHIKSKISLRTNKMVDELYYNFKTPYVQHKLKQSIEAKNRKIISSHYNSFEQTSGYDVMIQTDRGSTVDEIIEEYTDSHT
jgi:hypothetical protein